MNRPIHPGLAPNLEKEDFFVALSQIFRPDLYNAGNETQKLEKWFEDFYHEKAYAFASARGALFAVLKSLGITSGDEVAVVGFTCIAVIDAILATGAKPVYIDIQEDFRLDSADLLRKTTKKTRVLILQHTFGISSISEKVLQFAKSKNIFIVEDVAHGIGIADNKKLLGTYGIASIFSLGRDKAFSSVSGGVAIAKDKKIAQELEKFQENQNFPSKFFVFQNLFHVISFYLLVLPFYDMVNLGKIFLVMFQKMGLLAKPVADDELEHYELFYKKLSPSLSKLALSQLKRLNRFNKIRQKHTALYQKELGQRLTNATLLRFPLLVEDPMKLKKLARKENIYLGDWYSNGVDPKGTDLSEIFYTSGMCPNDEYISQHIINLPTYPTLSDNDREKVVEIVRTYATYQRNNK